MEWYEIEFKLYQYNSGAADNGTRIRSITYETLEEAILIKNRINRVYELKDTLPEDDEDLKWVCELIQDYTICGGFLKSGAEIYKITKTKI